MAFREVDKPAGNHLRRARRARVRHRDRPDGRSRWHIGVDTLKGKGPFTVFAPTDAAFAKIPKADLDALLKDKAKLTEALTYHVVAGKVMAADVAKLSEAKTVEGQSIRIDTSSGVKVDGANVVKTDILASNGVIHVIDSVMLPR